MENEKSERERELEEIPFRKADKAGWPKGVRGIGLDEVDGIGVDAEGDLYWHGKRVQTRARLDLNWRQILYGVIIAVFTVIGGCGAAVQGWTAYHDWACKVGWRAVACPPEAPPPSSSGSVRRD